jgi:tRNA A37 threonylcarbamoyladenosine modification protein TsaB
MADAPGPILAAIDARRGNWFTQLYRLQEESLPEALGEPHWGPPAEHPLHRAAAVVGFGVARLAELGDAAPGLKVLEPEYLAAAAARLAPRLPRPWQSSTLSHPLYLLPPSVSRPRP